MDKMKLYRKTINYVLVISFSMLYVFLIFILLDYHNIINELPLEFYHIAIFNVFICILAFLLFIKIDMSIKY